MKSMKMKLYDILKDGEWHGCKDLVHLGLSYRNRIAELRKDGYEIESEREKGKTTFRYKLIHDKL